MMAALYAAVCQPLLYYFYRIWGLTYALISILDIRYVYTMLTLCPDFQQSRYGYVAMRTKYRSLNATVLGLSVDILRSIMFSLPIAFATTWNWKDSLILDFVPIHAILFAAIVILLLWCICLEEKEEMKISYRLASDIGKDLTFGLFWFVIIFSVAILAYRYGIPFPSVY